jgi:hypothetical protein
MLLATSRVTGYGLKYLLIFGLRKDIEEIVYGSLQILKYM